MDRGNWILSAMSIFRVVKRTCSWYFAFYYCVVINTYVVTVMVALGWDNQSQANISQVLWKCLYFPRKNMFWFQSWSAATYNKTALRPVDFGRLSFLCCYSSCLLTKFCSVACSAHFSTTTTSLGPYLIALEKHTWDLHMTAFVLGLRNVVV